MRLPAGCNRAAPSGPGEVGAIMLVRVKATVGGIGEAEGLADLGRPHRIGAVIGALMEELERAHPGVPLLDHGLTIESGPATGEPDAMALIR